MGAIQAIEFGGDDPNVSTQRFQRVDDEAAEPGVRAVDQKWPDAVAVPQPEQGHGRACLTLGEIVPGLLADRGPMPDRRRHQWAFGHGSSSGNRDRAVSQGDQLPAVP